VKDEGGKAGEGGGGEQPYLSHCIRERAGSEGGRRKQGLAGVGRGGGQGVRERERQQRREASVGGGGRIARCAGL
jgi:hypothetical protein